MKQLLTTMIAQVKNHFKLDSVEIIADFINDKVYVNGGEQPPDDFMKNKEMINTVLSLKYGITAIDCMVMTETQVKVYYQKEGKKLIKEL